MHIAEIRTVAKSLPPLRWNTHKSLILSYSADFSVIFSEKGGAYIYVMRRDSTVERRFIELGPEFQNQVVVERGLAANEKVVTEGIHKLSPGIKVRPVKPTEMPSAETTEHAGTTKVD